MNTPLDNYTRYAVALNEMLYARKLLSEVCFVADRPLCEAAVRKAEEKLAAARAAFFEELDSQAHTTDLNDFNF